MKLDLLFEQNQQNINVPFSESGGQFNTNFGEASVIHDGQNGATFYPEVSADGIISWTNDRELPNPNPVNIKGEKGDKGDKGERGLQGERGYKGDKGDKGDRGDQGEQGIQGEKGDQGERGEQGIQGEKGERGDKGDKGEKGDPGEVTLEYANNTFSNALKGTKSDTEIFLDDISPVAHEIEVKISSDTVTDLTAVKVKRCGSNLFDGNLIPGVYNSTDLDNPETSGYAPKYQSIKIYLKAGTYTISSSVLMRFVRAIVDGVYKNISKIGTSYTFSATTDGYCGFSFRREDNLNLDGSEKIWINMGSSAFDYEQYALAEYTPNADGTVNGVTSLYPNTTLTTDTEGVIIDCEYNRDINKAFAELQAAIISTGGNV